MKKTDSLHKKLHFYKSVYSGAWIVLVFFLTTILTLILLFGFKAAGVFLLRYSPTWIPLLLFVILTILYGSKLIRLYEKQL